MGFSGRMFLLDDDDGLYRLPNSQFDRMLQDPASVCLSRFAGRRVRTASLVIEVLGRQPVRVVRTTFGFLTLDGGGRLDHQAFWSQHRAYAELALAPVFGAPERTSSVIDAASRFVVQGGQWKPSWKLAQRIGAAALGEVKCARL